MIDDSSPGHDTRSMAQPGLPMDTSPESPQPESPQGAPRRKRLGSGADIGEARLREMIDSHFDFIWRLTRRLGVREADVDDAVQQVFWVAARKLDVILPGRERAYLSATALRVASDARRSRSRHPEDASSDVGSESDPTPGPDELTEQRRARRLLDEILDSMAPDLRTVFVLFELEELTTPEIAELLDLPLGTAASRLRRARQTFQSAVERWRSMGELRENG